MHRVSVERQGLWPPDPSSLPLSPEEGRVKRRMHTHQHTPSDPDCSNAASQQLALPRPIAVRIHSPLLQGARDETEQPAKFGRSVFATTRQGLPGWCIAAVDSGCSSSRARPRQPTACAPQERPPRLHPSRAVDADVKRRRRRRRHSRARAPGTHRQIKPTTTWRPRGRTAPWTSFTRIACASAACGWVSLLSGLADESIAGGASLPARSRAQLNKPYTPPRHS